MSSFEVLCKSIVPGVLIRKRELQNGVVLLGIYNESSRVLPKLLTWAVLAPVNAVVTKMSNRTIYRIPADCDFVSAVACIGIMHSDTPEEYHFLAVEINNPEFAGDNSPLPHIHQCGKFLD